MTVQPVSQDAPRGSFNLYDPRLRGVVYQVLLLGVLVAIVYTAGHYAVLNMAKLGIPLNFAFWNQTAGFEINQTLISYSALSSYGQAFWVGLLNTLLVSAIGVVLATVIGFVVAIFRLAPNWMVSKLATVYVELFRNIPLLLQLVFWYNVVLKSLPAPRQSISVFGLAFLNNRGLVLPSPTYAPSAWLIGVAFLVAIAASAVVWRWATIRQAKTGQQFPSISVAFGLLIGLPLLAFVALGFPIGLDIPQLKGFNFSGGKPVFPELAALVMGLSIYTGAFISEIVRSGIQAVGPRVRSACGPTSPCVWS